MEVALRVILAILFSWVWLPLLAIMLIGVLCHFAAAGEWDMFSWHDLTHPFGAGE